MSYNVYIPTDLYIGSGCLEKLGEVSLPGKKALIVISAGKSMRANGYLERVCGLLEKQSVEFVVFDKILPNPILTHVMEGADAAKKNGCDFVIGLGGGSSIDSAKSIAVMAVNEGDYWDYINGGSGKGKPVTNGALPVVAITTTAGTGTEADPWTVITKEDTKEKIGFGNRDTFPVLSFVDPDLMLTVPPHLTAYQGFDALFHATEGYIANISTPISDMYALKSIELIAKYLPIAVKDGKNLEAREKVALANTLSGMVESVSSCTSEHSIEHAMSAYHPELPHGAGLIMVSLEYYRLFAQYIPEKLAEMARVMGKDLSGKSVEEQAQEFVNAVAELQQACNVGELKMSDYGLNPSEFDEIATCAVDTMGGLFQMDRHKLSHEEIVGIISKSYR